MRFFTKSLIAILIAAVIAGALTYPIWLAVSQLADFRPDRVMRRIGVVLLAIALIVLLRREGLLNKSVLGYGMPRSQFVRQVFVGFVIGIALMLPLAGALFALDVRNFADLSPAIVGKAALLGIVTGLAVAFIEETFMRGAMYSVIERESGLAYAFVLPAILYAAVHFFDGKLRIPANEMDFGGGLKIAAHIFERFAAPHEIVDSFFALFALGVLLALLRHRTGAIAGSIGLHAGGVCVITFLRLTSAANDQAPLRSLAGTYDGVIGWLAFAWISLIAFVYWRWTTPSVPRLAAN